MNEINEKYIPKTMKNKDRIRQSNAIRRSRKAYLHQKYLPRPHLDSFHSKKSHYVERAKKMFGVSSIGDTPELANKSECSRSSLRKILRKGRGAYYSSGSRPNQTAESWARARLASALTGGPASRVDAAILIEGCKHPLIYNVL
jgi:hypothetical protein